MSIGDALKDMPDEYREYVEKVRAGDTAQLDYIYEKIDEMHEMETKESEQSEADKAIADGKPRWMYLEQPGWQYVVLLGRKFLGVHIRNGLMDGIVYQHAVGNASATQVMVALERNVKILPYGETAPPAEPEKPAPVASIVFKHDGGEWLHMADNIIVDNTPLKVPKITDDGCYIHTEKPRCKFTIYGIEGGSPGGFGHLTVNMLGSGQVFKGNATVVEYGNGEMLSTPNHVVFEMVRDVPQPEYEPDSLQLRYRMNLNTGEMHEGCPDCDAHTESRSMPDGIEQWCPVCNVKVELEEDIQDIPEADLDAVIQEIASSKELTIYSTQMNVNPFYSVDTAKIVRLIVEKFMKHETKDEVAEGPMHPDMIRERLRNAECGGYRIKARIKREHQGLYAANGGNVTKVTDAVACVGGVDILIETIESISQIQSKV